MKKIFVQFVLPLLLFLAPLSQATYISLRSSEVNMRVGPGKEYPIIWVFMRANLPMLLMAEFDQWRKVKFLDGTIGWVHKNMISYKNCAIVTENYTLMYEDSSKKRPLAKLEKGVIAHVIKKNDDLIQIIVNNQKGWVDKKFLWGVNEQ